MRNAIQEGDHLTIIAPATVASGAGVISGVMFGVAIHAASSGAELTIATRGVYEMAKVSAQAWTLGQALYFIPGSGLVTTATTSGNLFIGYATAAAANPSATGFVRLNGSAPTAVTP